MPQPGYLKPTALPGLDTSIVRVTDAAVFGGNRRVYRHFYSKRQPWNSDGSLILLAHQNPSYLIDGKTFELVQTFKSIAEPVWSNSNPDILYGVPNNSTPCFLEYRVSTNVTRVVRSFPEYIHLYIGGGEGNISNDDRYAPLLGIKSDGVDVLVYDIKNDVVISKKEFPGLIFSNGLDWVTISPSGRYIVVNLNGNGVKAYDVYDSKTMKFLRRLKPGTGGSHADIGVDRSGNEVLVTNDPSKPGIISIRLSDGFVRQELSAAHGAWNKHFSCRNHKRPGYCYVSTFAHIGGFNAFMYREIFALKLDGSGTVERFTQNFAAPLPVADLSYSRETHAAPNRDGSQVLFATDWEDPSSTAVIHTYVSGVQLIK